MTRNTQPHGNRKQHSTDKPQHGLE